MRFGRTPGFPVAFLLLLLAAAAPAQQAGAGAFSEPPGIAYLTGIAPSPRFPGSAYALRISGLLPSGLTDAGSGWTERVFSGGTFEVVRYPSDSPAFAETAGTRVGAGRFLSFRALVRPASGQGTFQAQMVFTESGPLGREGGTARLSGFLGSPIPMPEVQHLPWLAILVNEEFDAVSRESWGLLKSSFR
jgi:hypothetical protein